MGIQSRSVGNNGRGVHFASDRSQVILRLENIVKKAMIQVQAAENVECVVRAPFRPSNVYTIEISADRYSRQIPVDPELLVRIDVAQSDPAIMRELRTAFLTISRLSRIR